MTKTNNYQLNQWDAGDRVLRQDFNADNQKIDAALKAIQDALPEPDVAVGTYIGTNNSAKPTHILLGFQPSAVLIAAASTSLGTFSTLITQNAYVAFGQQPMAKITEDGFMAATVIYSGNTLTPHLNADRTYCYVAFR